MVPADRDRLARVLGLLSSPEGGERATAAWKAHQNVVAAGCSWGGLLRAEPESVLTEKLRRALGVAQAGRLAAEAQAKAAEQRARDAVVQAAQLQRDNAALTAVRAQVEQAFQQLQVARAETQAQHSVQQERLAKAELQRQSWMKATGGLACILILEAAGAALGGPRTTSATTASSTGSRTPTADAEQQLLTTPGPSPASLPPGFVLQRPVVAGSDTAARPFAQATSEPLGH